MTIQEDYYYYYLPLASNGFDCWLVHSGHCWYIVTYPTNCHCYHYSYLHFYVLLMAADSLEYAWFGYLRTLRLPA